MKIHAKIKEAMSQITGDYRSYLPENIMSRWQPEVHAAADDDGATINMYDIIGEDFWTGAGMTEKIVSKVLRQNKGKAVTVNINSPGGDFFQGVAIYNLLKAHDGDVNVRVVGMAASAASVIAMAGTSIKVAESGFLMIHNAWNCLCGNKHEMRDMADTLSQFDESMVGIYAKHCDLDEDEIREMMDAETWISGKDCVERGFATELLDEDEIDVEEDEQAKYNSALKTADLALAKANYSRSERRGILKDLTNTPGAVVNEPITPRADENELADSVLASVEKLTKYT